MKVSDMYDYPVSTLLEICEVTKISPMVDENGEIKKIIVEYTPGSKPLWEVEQIKKKVVTISEKDLFVGLKNFSDNIQIITDDIRKGILESEEQ